MSEDNNEENKRFWNEWYWALPKLTCFSILHECSFHVLMLLQNTVRGTTF